MLAPALLVLLAIASGASAELVGHWTFEGVTDGIVPDLAGDDDAGILLGGMSIVVVDAPWGGGTTRAARFNGQGDQIELVETGSLSLGTGQWSYAGWFKIEGTVGTRGGCLYAERGGTGKWGPAAIVINITPTGELDLFFRDLANNNVSGVTSGLGIQNDVWNHVAVVRDGGTIKAYLNGQFAWEKSGTLHDMTMAGVSATTPLGNYPRLGMHPNQEGQWQFSGLMADVRVYNHALSEAEIDDLLISGGASGGISRARNPNPPDGAIGVASKVVLTWTPGDYVPATSGHRVYFSQNFDDVNDGLPAALKGIQSTSIYPEVGTLDLDWGERYYWRIDEVNDTFGWDEGAVWEFTALTKPVYLPGLVISEFMADNSKTLFDGEGRSSDWIEIYNSNESDISLAGWYLTDDEDLSTKWRFPDRAFIPSEGYLVVFASGKGVDDYVDPDGYYHTNFKLSKDGEYLALVDPSGRIEHQYAEYACGDGEFGYKPQETDISYGLHGGQKRYFSLPTPGTDNDGFFVDFVADPEFSVQRGFYDTPSDVVITCDTEGATIHYTIDGSTPSSKNGFEYDNTVPIPVTTTTCLRVVASKPGWLTSRSITQTYVFLEDVIRQPANLRYLSGEGLEQYPSHWDRTADYEMDPDVVGSRGTDVFGGVYHSTIREDLKSLPSMSLVMDVDDMFGPTGIYSKPTVDGLERPVSVELLYPSEYERENGLDGFQIDAAIRIHGRRSRICAPKHALRLVFKQPYGPSKLEYPLFENCPVNSFDTIVLRAYSNHSWLWQSQTRAGGRKHAQYIRDQWSRDTQRAMGQSSTYGTYVHLYINGLYWGLYSVHERPDERFLSAHIGGDRDDWDVINSGEVINGDSTAWNTLINMANHDDLSNPDSYEQIKQHVDLENLIDTMLLYHYSGDTDWIGNNKNWYACRKREAGAGFLFFTWDAEACLINLHDNNIAQNADRTGARVFHSLQRQNEEFRILLADRIHRHFFNEGALTPEKVSERFMFIAEKIDDAIVGESARWGDWRRDVDPSSCGATGPFELYTKYDHWIPEQERLLDDYFPFRTDLVLQWYRDLGFYPSVDAPEFNQHGGWDLSGFALAMSGPGAIWYTFDGTDPRPEGAGQGTTNTITIVLENAGKRVLVPTGPVSNAWRGGSAFDDSSWRAGAGGVGYERSSGYQSYIDIDVESDMYNKNGTCYIRIPFNMQDYLPDLSSLLLRVRYDDGFVAYLNGVQVAAHNAPSSPSWNSNATTNHLDSQAVTLINFDISAHRNALRIGSNILAIQALNQSTGSSDLLLSVALVTSETTGGSPGIVSPTAIQYHGPFTLEASARVKARALSGSTWSALNEAVFAVGPVAESLRISEIMYHPNDPNEEYIELTNIGSQAINLNLVSFTNGIDFTFGNVELGPGQYALVVEDVNAFESRYGPGLPVAGEYSGKLNNAGERIELNDAIGRMILNFRYEDGWRSITDGDGFSLTIIDAANPDLSSWDEKDSWRPSAYAGGSPDSDDSDIIPEPGAIVINEVLAHSHAEASDWIELYNTTGSTIDVGGWFLSDSNDNLTKYEIADGTTIGPNGYLVLYEDLNFGNANDPGTGEPFALSENGEQLYLSSAQNNVLTGYRNVEDFGASETDVSFGRYYKSSTGNYNFVAMEQNTPGSANSYPKVGPVVISEIMYNPSWPEGGAYTNDQYEYIELQNISAEPVTLYRYDKAVPWKFTDGIDFTFGADALVTIPADGKIVIARKPAAFSWRYPAVPAGIIFGPYEDKLNNAGESLELGIPGDVDSKGIRQYIRVDRINYSDGSHPAGQPGNADLWPTAADGQGLSLQRIIDEDYGNDPSNWTTGTPSPGADGI